MTGDNFRELVKATADLRKSTIRLSLYVFCVWFSVVLLAEIIIWWYAAWLSLPLIFGAVILVAVALIWFVQALHGYLDARDAHKRVATWKD